jgi:hypothetical protein
LLKSQIFHPDPLQAKTTDDLAQEAGPAAPTLHQHEIGVGQDDLEGYPR